LKHSRESVNKKDEKDMTISSDEIPPTAKGNVRKIASTSITTRLLVRDIMNNRVISLSVDDSIKDIAEKMIHNKIGSIIILRAGKHVGIVTDREIVTVGLIADKKPSNIKAEEVMRELYTIDADAYIAEAAKLLRKYNIKRLGVVSNGKIVGVISASDVIAAMPSLVDVVFEKAAIFRYDIGIPRTESKISGYCDVCEEWSDLLKYSEGMFICEECTEQASSTTGVAEGD
jgi:CBS domain-containing protein